MTMWQPELKPSSLAKYKQVADAIDEAVASGALKAGEKLPPQRRLADALGVTIGTITRSYAEAERRGTVVARVGSGTYIKQAEPGPYVMLTADDSRYDLRSSKAPAGPQGDLMAQALMEIAGDRQLLATCLDYQPETGLKHQRQQLADWLSGRNLVCSADEVLFTYGGQHGISLSLQATCRSGDTVLCEGLSFPGIALACQEQQLKCHGLAMDDQGVLPQALISACQQYNPRVIYLTSQVQNPSCVQMPLSRKLELIAICRQYQLLILDDDVQFLPESEKVSSFYLLAPELTIYISSFSKSFSGGLRLGYLVARDRLRSDLRKSLRASCWTIPPVMVELVCRWLTSGKMAEQEAWLTREMLARHRILQKELAGYPLTTLPYAFNAWLSLPEHWRAVDFVQHALAKGLLLRAAESYAIGRFPAPQNIRISLCAPRSHERLKQALLLLKQCLEDTPASDELVM
ncbi:PLP-dependent aminotransferase family protein [Thalassomonas actiniarum]|uniref:PLP-dependent aminotransferase family protein n=1 Tax=Thalassomonas actiniarum TaxID=485447 RepID=A0AAE9YP09_9GAMM|nr:PLP-dependent aminotransferase family protein [Thalassomonas actiniarum]WDD98570.1 PLP-dependent aminotransferase family protein [Thalassomonas actiniarum]